MDNFKQTLDKSISIAKAYLLKNGIHCYWWNKKTNFGDLLTPEIMNVFGKTPIHSYPAQHNKNSLVMVGSLIQMLPYDYNGNIIGSGMICDKKLKLPAANIWSVRGELTKKAMGLPIDLPTGDVGLLAKKLLKQVHLPKYTLGVIPHYVDKNNLYINNLADKYPKDILIIDVQRTAHRVIHDIASCTMVASSSLHGIIASDALGLPNCWLELSNNVFGNGFKFYDYNSSLEYEQHPFRISENCTLLEIEEKMSEKSQNKIAHKKLSIEMIMQKFIREKEKSR